ncbi:tRNA pseudouridine(38/39) synthase isoform X3 [Hordeum vulgare subsp. vulgare]|uniref:tRNA pseudouridine(38/39) synthase isoform X3 n=1 Tax=Hordeum vulgare subsp. vulgare TaxID=112509 RepID=UPI001D1A4C25|nr:tRNA pseudouridine(38/39) synthase isoform X3 [Hordeum vulgare subsp. vulgare]
MAAGDGGDTVAVPTEIAALRLRVLELERENQRLAQIASTCSCGSKEDNIPPSLVENRDQQVQKNVKSQKSRISDYDVSLPFDHMMISTENQVLCDVKGEGHDDLSKIRRKHSKRTGHQVGNVSHCQKRLIALKIMYFGQRFYGFASEAHTEPTVESEIFKALERARLLVGSIKDACYSRCGRTDKGVSATGQVISLYLRSNFKEAGGNVLGERSEIDYVSVLNRNLPRDIRVIGWCPVSADFLARFSCLGREYKYLFWKGGLDVSEAAFKFIGEHDLRNFCKMDAANVSNYKRCITDFTISACDQRSNHDELWSMNIRGSAFLWHQVRCMVAVLFLVGQGLESPCVVDSLLDITKTPRKPQYTMAPELPLILRSCLFDRVNFMCSSDASQALIEHLKDEYHQYMLQAAIFDEALTCLCIPDVNAEANPSESPKKKRKHIPLLSRETEPSYEERRARVKAKSATCS